LFSNNFDRNLQLVFEVLDFDNDGFISKEDVRVTLSHVPMSQVLCEMNVKVREEGLFTKSGGGLYLLSVSCVATYTWTECRPRRSWCC
jgi:hypothetical protein